MTCARCAARMRPGDAWCSQCLLPLGEPVEQTPGLLQRSGPPPSQPVFLPTYSRWRKSDTSFGPVGRVAWTVGMLLLAAMTIFSGNPFAIAPICLFAVPVVLRSVWAKSRVS